MDAATRLDLLAAARSNDYQHYGLTQARYQFDGYRAQWPFFILDIAYSETCSFVN
jgi:hypothetical protein